MKKVSKIDGLIYSGSILSLFATLCFVAHAAEDNSGKAQTSMTIVVVPQESYQDYVSGELNREAAEKAAARQRQERVRAARDSWSQDAERNRQGNRSRALANRDTAAEAGKTAEETEVLDPVEEREINNAALLSVYDADNSGDLDEQEQKQILEDSQVDSVDLTAVSRWQTMKQKIEANMELGETEKAQLLEQIQVKIDTLSAQEGSMENE